MIGYLLGRFRACHGEHGRRFHDSYDIHSRSIGSIPASMLYVKLIALYFFFSPWKLLTLGSYPCLWFSSVQVNQLPKLGILPLFGTSYRFPAALALVRLSIRILDAYINSNAATTSPLWACENFTEKMKRALRNWGRVWAETLEY